jgi:sugar phosphate isomerase/epimerase
VNPLSLAPLTITHATPTEYIEAAAQAGFDAVGLRVVAPAGVVEEPPIAGNEARLREVERCLTANGLSVLDVNSFWITSATTREDFRPVLEAACRVRAGSILTVISDDDIGRASAVFAECCALAEPAGLKVALEFMPYGSVRNLGEAADIVERSGFRNAGIVLDVLHLFRSGGGPADLAGVPAERLAFVQICDAPLRAPAFDALRAEARGGRLYPGQGELPLFDLMRALPPGIALDVETPCAAASNLSAFEQARRAADTTRRFLADWEQHRPQSAAERGAF